MGNTYIEARQVSKYVKVGKERITILNKVDLVIGKGELVAITGKSGSGKSSLLGVLAGLDKPTEGEILIGGISLYDKTEKELAYFRNQEIGMIFQNYNLMDELTCRENIEIPLLFSRNKKVTGNEIQEILKKLGMEGKGKLYPPQMSGGEQQRTAIGRAFVNRPGMIFADEPTGSLDSANSDKIIRLLKKLRKERNTTIVIVTHDEETAYGCDRRLVIKDGRVFQDK